MMRLNVESCVELDSVYLGELLVLAALECQRHTGKGIIECMGMVLYRVECEGIDWLMPVCKGCQGDTTD